MSSIDFERENSSFFYRRFNECMSLNVLSLELKFISYLLEKIFAYNKIVLKDVTRLRFRRKTSYMSPID